MFNSRSVLKPVMLVLVTTLGGTALTAAIRGSAPIAQDDTVAEAKKTVNRLMPQFTKVKIDKKKGLTAIHTSIDQIENTLKKTHTNDLKRQPFGYYILTATIKEGRLAAYSQWLYRTTNVIEVKTEPSKNLLETIIRGGTYLTEVPAPNGDLYELDHNSIKVTVNGITKAIPLKVRKGYLSTLSAVLTNSGPRVESGEVMEDVEGFLRFVTNNNDEQVVLNLVGKRGESGEFGLSEPLLIGMAQTLELYDAVQVLKNAGEQLKTRY